MKQDILNPWTLKLFTTVVETGSFSQAALELDCAQSAVSYGITNLESQLGVDLFERGRRKAVLTEVGKVIFVDARNIEIKLLDLRARALDYKRGVETKLTFAVDSMYPAAKLAALLRQFSDKFPDVALDLRIGTLGRVLQLITDRDCDFGICGPADQWPDAIDVVTLNTMELIPVAAPDHALSRQSANVTTSELRKHIQLILSEESGVKMGQDFCVYATHHWNVSDISTKHHLLCAGAGWGMMPRYMVDVDLAAGNLVPLNLGSLKSVAYVFHLIRPINGARGPVSGWLTTQLVASQ
ncbi:MAG: LysR family transcriptional regulator [Pseudomonadota bacterium]